MIEAKIKRSSASNDPVEYNAVWKVPARKRLQKRNSKIIYFKQTIVISCICLVSQYHQTKFNNTLLGCKQILFFFSQLYLNKFKEIIPFSLIKFLQNSSELNKSHTSNNKKLILINLCWKMYSALFYILLFIRV